MSRAGDIYSRLDEFAALEDGWDSYGAPPITAEAIASAKHLIGSLGITPTNRGGVQVYLASEGVAVEFDSEGAVHDVWIGVADINDYVTALKKREASDG